MREIALTLPGTTTTSPFTVTGPAGLKPQFDSLGGFLTQFYPVILYIAAFLMIFWMAWGIFQYIFAGGDKESLSKARSRITWAIVGFMILIIAFSLGQYVKSIFPQVNQFEQSHPAKDISTPP